MPKSVKCDRLVKLVDHYIGKENGKATYSKPVYPDPKNPTDIHSFPLPVDFEDLCSTFLCNGIDIPPLKEWSNDDDEKDDDDVTCLSTFIPGIKLK